MKYRTGETVEIGDNVLIDNGETEGIIEGIVETDEELADWGFTKDQKGVFIKAKPYDVFFTKMDAEIITFVSRQNS